MPLGSLLKKIKFSMLGLEEIFILPVLCQNQAI